MNPPPDNSLAALSVPDKYFLKKKKKKNDVFNR